MEQKESQGLFVVFEGGEGSGKTTQTRMLYERLIALGHDAFLTKQPGGDESVCRAIRSLVLDPQYFGRVSSRAELLLFMADKAQHIDFVVRPALSEGKTVLCDRYLASTYAYQVAARESCTKEEFSWLAGYATRGFQPDLTIWLDADPAIGLQRNDTLPSQQLRFEKETLEFHERVRKGYEEYFVQYSDSSGVVRIDASQSVEKIHEIIVEKISTLFRHMNFGVGK